MRPRVERRANRSYSCASRWVNRSRTACAWSLSTHERAGSGRYRPIVTTGTAASNSAGITGSEDSGSAAITPSTLRVRSSSRTGPGSSASEGISKNPYPDSAAAAESPWRSGGKYGLRTNESPENGTCRPNVMVRPVARPLAVRLGRYSRASAARRTFCRVSGATGRFPENTWETVVIDTPARRATSWIPVIGDPSMRIMPAPAVHGDLTAKRFVRSVVTWLPARSGSGAGRRHASAGPGTGDLLGRGRRSGGRRGWSGGPVEVSGGGRPLGPGRGRCGGHPGPRRRLAGTSRPRRPGRGGRAGGCPGDAPGERPAARHPTGGPDRRTGAGGLVHRCGLLRARVLGGGRGVRVPGQHHCDGPGGAGHGRGVWYGHRLPGRADAGGAPRRPAR